jgi:hypothetical protein
MLAETKYATKLNKSAVTNLRHEMRFMVSSLPTAAQPQAEEHATARRIFGYNAFPCPTRQQK